MIRKISILIPLLILAVLAGAIIWVNMGDLAVPAVQAEPEETAEVEKLKMSKYNPANPKSYYQQATESAFDGTIEGFLASVHQTWHELTEEERYDGSVYSASYDIIASVVLEINFLNAHIPSEWEWKFDALQETAHQLTSPVNELSQEERDELIPVFEDDLKLLYAKLVESLFPTPE